MAYQILLEVYCDNCGGCCHYTLVRRVSYRSLPIPQMLRSSGWIITATNKHFDSKECYENYKKENRK
jgi:hypothetical protein